MIRVAVVGAGYWGPNLIRNFAACPDTHLVAVCDRDTKRLAMALSEYPGVEPIRQFDEIVDRSDIDAVAIATPVSTHAPMGIAALQAGKHVLIEKPLAASVADAEKLVATAGKVGRVLMVDHTYIYSGPVQRIKQIIDAGELGDLYFIDSVRINLGMFQHDVNVVWDLAPHDLSILDYLVGRLPRSISAFGSCHANEVAEIEDVAYLNLDFSDGLVASFHVNWLSPVKVRHFIVGGSKKSIVYDDLEPAERVKVYDRGITINDDMEAKRGVMVGYRTGDVWSPHIPQVEPLAQMVRHFAECIRENKQPLTNGEAGLRIVKILEAAQRSIKAQGGRITIWNELRRAA
jgi:predicted dehydrogenase